MPGTIFEPATLLPTIVVIDDFLKDPIAVRQLALQQTYKKQGSVGLRSEVKFQELEATFEHVLRRQLQSVGGVSGAFEYCVAENKTVFHSDEQEWAGAIYLTPDAPVESGLTLWRHRRLQLRYPPTEADAVRLGVSRRELERQMYQGQLFDGTRWEVVDKIGNVFNRLVLWPGHHVHSASCYFGNSIENARLFHVFFLNVRRPA